MADIPENLYTPTRDAEKQANLDSWVARHTSADPTRAVDQTRKPSYWSGSRWM